MENNLPLPIEHLSYSSLSQYLTNRWLFKKHYILHDWTGRDSNPSWATGKGFHKTMELYYSGMGLNDALTKGYEVLEQEAADVNWASYKTVTIEKCKADLAKTVNFYMAEEPDLGEVLATEKVILTGIEIEGQKMPLPIKVVVDVVHRKKEGLCITDYKTVTSFSDLEKDQPNYILQAMFGYHSVKQEFKEEPYAAYFIEIKKSANRDGSSQIQIYEIIYEKHPEYQVYFGKLYGGIIEELVNPDLLYLPNLRDMFSSEETWADFTSEAMDFNQPKQVSHKSVMDTAVDGSKKGFVESVEPTTPEDQIMSKLLEFGIPMKFKEKHVGPNVIMYTFKPSRGISMKKIMGYEEDLMQGLGSESVRIEAPIKGTKLVGIEIANKEQGVVVWEKALLKPNSLNIPVGLNVYGDNVSIDLAEAPHLLVAGATGMGKSVFLNSAILSLSQQNDPTQLGLILIDPKLTEFMAFESLPHLESEIQTDTVQIYKTLLWLCEEMDSRYKKMRDVKARDLDTYNKKGAYLKRLVVVVDELADLMLTREALAQGPSAEDSIDLMFGGKPKKKAALKLAGEIENLIIRLAQKSRAAGIHLILATQRPSVDVITGVLKANLPTRVAFMTSSSVDSGVILDSPGAERLIGNGDLLLKNPRKKGLERLQGYFI